MYPSLPVQPWGYVSGRVKFMGRFGGGGGQEIWPSSPHNPQKAKR